MEEKTPLTLPRQPGIVCPAKSTHCLALWFLIFSSLSGAGGLLFAAPVTNTSYNATLAWDASASAATNGLITNYNLYWGTASRTYTNSFGVGTNLTGIVSNLSFGVPYYFAATATDSNGMESDYSAEVWTNVPPAPLSPTNLRLKVIR